VADQKAEVEAPGIQKGEGRMTEKERKEAQRWMGDHLRKISRDISNVRRFGVYAGMDGWNSPPAVMPRAGELAMGIFYDPEKNTR